MRIFLLATALTALPLLVHAAPILTFGQDSNSNTVTGTANLAGTQTTISGADVAVTITQDIGGILGPAFFDLHVTSTDAAQSVGAAVVQHYAGSFSVTTLPGGAGINVLSGSFTDAALGAGPGLGLTIGAPPDLINFSSAVIPAAELAPPLSVLFSLTNVTPPVSVDNTTIAGFTAAVAGDFSSETAAVPEPASMAVLAVGLLGLGFLRRKVA